MSVLEAWAHGVPVLMTEFCNLPEGFAAGAAREIGTGVPSIAAGLEALFVTAKDELQEMGQRGQALVQTNFHWPNIASQMREVYGWMLGGGTRPASFYQA